jgi:hypothetical protein
MERRESEDALSETGVASRGQKEGRREWGATLHPRFAWFPVSQGYEAHVRPSWVKGGWRVAGG